MKKKYIYIFSISISSLCAFEAHAYTVIESLELSPGCEGGIEYTITESRFVSSMEEALKGRPDVQVFYPDEIEP